MATVPRSPRQDDPIAKARGDRIWRRSSHSGTSGNCIEATPVGQLAWRKSLRSGNEGNCIEAAAVSSAAWWKSSHTGSQGNCVEVSRRAAGAVAVRDSKDAEGAKLLFPAAAWREFTRTLKAWPPTRS
jgi:hypothetical protein